MLLITGLVRPRTQPPWHLWTTAHISQHPQHRLSPPPTHLPTPPRQPGNRGTSRNAPVIAKTTGDSIRVNALTMCLADKYRIGWVYSQLIYGHIPEGSADLPRPCSQDTNYVLQMLTSRGGPRARARGEGQALSRTSALPSPRNKLERPWLCLWPPRASSCHSSDALQTPPMDPALLIRPGTQAGGK